jgi:hypothetical protein
MARIGPRIGLLLELAQRALNLLNCQDNDGKFGWLAFLLELGEQLSGRNLRSAGQWAD